MARIMRDVALWHVASAGGGPRAPQKYTRARVATGLERAPLQRQRNPLRKRSLRLRVMCNWPIATNVATRERTAYETGDTVRSFDDPTILWPPITRALHHRRKPHDDPRNYARNITERIVAITPLRGVSVKSGERSTF